MSAELAAVAGFCAGLLVGGALLWLARSETVRVLDAQLEQARTAERVATDRLVHAWREGATVPPRPVEAAPPPEPLPSELQAELDQWEEPEHKAMLERKMRELIQAGRSTVAVLMELDNLHP